MSIYYCKKAQCSVEAEKSRDITGRVFNSCGYYALSSVGQSKYPCIKFSPRFRKCDVVKLVEREEEKSLVSF